MATTPTIPPSYWTTLISLAGLAVAILTLILTVSNDNEAKTQRLEQRLCRLEAHDKTGDCG